MEDLKIKMEIAVGVIVAVVVIILMNTSSIKKEMEKRAEKKSQSILDDTQEEIASLMVKAKDRAEQELERIKKTNAELEEQLKTEEGLLEEKEELVKKRDARVTQLSNTIMNLNKEIAEVQAKAVDLSSELINETSKKAGITPKEILDTMYSEFENQFFAWKESQMMRMEKEEFKEEVIPKAKSILRSCLQRYTESSSVDKKEYSFTLKYDEMKGPLVGPGGKNINYFEEKAQCAVIFNYEPNLVIVSCLNMYRRAIAKEALLSLSNEKKIDEKVIDAHLEKAKRKIDGIVDDFGKKACKLLGYHNLPKELIHLIGRFEFRTSFGQNIWKHSMEVAYFARMLAEEIGANVQRSLDAAFYHDLGKAIDHDLETSIGHDHLSKDLMEKFEIDPLTVHAAYAHHDAVPCIRPEDFLVKAADAMSASRPGARQQTMEKYIKLVSELQERASKFEGVDKVFTMSAGREVRVFVNKDKINDDSAQKLATEIAKDIEANMGYPGTIKINVVRSIEAYDTAKEKIPMKRR